jgi:putative DNA methylase
MTLAMSAILGRGVNKEKARIERERLFGIIRKLVLWENTNNEAVLSEAREEIRKSWRETCELNRNHPQAAELFNPEKLPAFHDPFAGGGAIAVWKRSGWGWKAMRRT